MEVGGSMTEQQKYDVVDRIGAVEIRRYRPCVMADVDVRGELTQAGNVGFGPLVSYISQSNIAMTAPVIQESPADGMWTVSFVMPAGAKLDDLPRPANSRVRLRASEEHVAAALRFSGYTGEGRVSDKERELRQALESAGIATSGPIRIARFDPPWKPGFLRHNEVVIPVEWPAAR